MNSDRDHRRDPAAREAGREAYRASKDLKKGARQAAHELNDAQHQFREGWKDAKHNDHPDTDREDRQPQH